MNFFAKYDTLEVFNVSLDYFKLKFMNCKRLADSMRRRVRRMPSQREISR